MRDVAASGVDGVKGILKGEQDTLALTLLVEAKTIPAITPIAGIVRVVGGKTESPILYPARENRCYTKDRAERALNRAEGHLHEVSLPVSFVAHANTEQIPWGDGAE